MKTYKPPNDCTLQLKVALISIFSLGFGYLLGRDQAIKQCLGANASEMLNSIKRGNEDTCIANDFQFIDSSLKSRPQKFGL